MLKNRSPILSAKLGVSASALLLSVLTACVAAQSPTAPQPAPLCPPVASSDSPQPDLVASAVEAQPTDQQLHEATQARALEACQAAEELLDQGDAAAAVEQADLAYQLMLQLPSESQASDDAQGDAVTQSKQDIRLVVAKVINRVYGADQPPPKGTTISWDLGLPMIDNQQVQREIKAFTTYERKHLLAGYQRAGRFRPMMLKKLEEAGLPSQLSWLPLVESAFKVQALSHAGAFGLWQFISSTGLRYGLKRDVWADERLDPEKATDAAIAYLSDLHHLFGDWPKALAAYNAGEGRIKRLQQRHADKYLDFWDLYAMLPDETRRYVPRLIAVIQIIENPDKYGVTFPPPDPPMPEGLQQLTVERSVELKALDAALGLPANTLANLNPALRLGATPKGRAYSLRIPGSDKSREELLAVVTALPEYKPAQPQYVIHRVRRGETLSGIAARYRTSVRTIMRFNRIRSANRIWPGQRLRIPVRG